MTQQSDGWSDICRNGWRMSDGRPQLLALLSMVKIDKKKQQNDYWSVVFKLHMAGTHVSDASCKKGCGSRIGLAAALSRGFALAWMCLMCILDMPRACSGTSCMHTRHVLHTSCTHPARVSDASYTCSRCVRTLPWS